MGEIPGGADVCLNALACQLATEKQFAKTLYRQVLICRRRNKSPRQSHRHEEASETNMKFLMAPAPARRFQVFVAQKNRVLEAASIESTVQFHSRTPESVYLVARV